MRVAFLFLIVAACGDDVAAVDASMTADVGVDTAADDAPLSPDAAPDAPECTNLLTELGDCMSPIVPVTPLSTETPNAEIVWTGAEYALVWVARDGGNARRVYLGRADAEGTLITSIAVSEGARDVYNPVIAWSGTELALAWSDSANHVQFLRATAAGASIGTPQQLTEASASAQGVQIAWNGARYGLAWHDGRDGNSEIYFASVDAGGAKQTADVRLTNTSARTWMPSITATATGFAIAWTEDASTFVNSVAWTRIDNAGAGSGMTITDTSSWIGDPHVIDRNGTLVIVWDDNRATDREIYFTTVDATGAEPGNDVRLTTTPAYSDEPFIAWNGTEHRVVWQESGTGMVVADLDTAGVQTTTTVTLAATPLSPARPRLIWTGDRYGVFWQGIDATMTSQRRLYFTSLTPTP